MKRPLLFPLLGLIVGILAFPYIAFSQTLHFALSILLLFLFSLFFFLNKQKFVLILVVLQFLVLGHFLSFSQYNFQNKNTEQLKSYQNEVLFIRARVEGRPIGLKEGPYKLPLRLLSLCKSKSLDEVCSFEEISALIQLSVQNNIPTVQEGDIVQFKSELKPLSGFKNFGLSNFQYQQSLKGIFYQAWVEDAAFLVKIVEEKNVLLNYKNSLFRKLSFELQGLCASQAQSKNDCYLLQALLLGERSIPDFQKEVFRKTGTSHLIVVSGLHLAMVSGFFYFIFRIFISLFPSLLLSIPTKKIAFLASLVPVMLYAYLIGYSSSLLRALLAFIACSILLLFNKITDAYSLLIQAAFWILLIYPLQLFELSFQLSFLSVFFIIYFHSLAQKYLNNKCYHSLFLCLGVQIGLIPILSYHFHSISLIAPLCNLILVPFYSFILMPLGMSWMLAKILSFNFFATKLLSLLCFSQSVAFDLLQVLSNLSWSSISVSGFNLFQCVAAYFLFLFVCLMKRKKYFLPALFFVLLINAALWIYPHWQRHYLNQVSIHFLDVGQGDACLLELPKGKIALIDSGGLASSSKTDIAERVLLPYLRQNQIDQIDIALITHPHPDHYLGLLGLLKNNYPIKNIWWNGETSSSESFQDLLALIAQKQIPLKIPKPKEQFAFSEDVKINFLFPNQPLQNLNKTSNTEVNNRSLVFKLTAFQESILFTGDIEEKSEAFLISQFSKDLHTSILKVPHHGSLTSSSYNFLKAVSPQMALIGLGLNNRFGFPKAEVLQRYQQQGIKVLRSDLNGSVKVILNSEGLFLKDYSQGTW